MQNVLTYCLRMCIVGRASIECVFSVQNAAATSHKYNMSSIFWQCCCTYSFNDVAEPSFDIVRVSVYVA